MKTIAVSSDLISMELFKGIKVKAVGLPRVSTVIDKMNNRRRAA